MCIEQNYFTNQGLFQAVWFTTVYRMKIEFSINLAQSHLKPTTSSSTMVGAEVSENVLKKGFVGEKELVNFTQSIRCGLCRYLFLFKHELIKNKNLKIKKSNIYK